MYKNKIVTFITMTVIAFMGIFSTVKMPVQANTAEVILCHHHCDSCKSNGYKVQNSTNSGNLTIERRDTCNLCGAEHHYYRFTCTCSCGKSWNTTGHACYNSPYGTGKGNCSNYSVINCSTSHNHPTKVINCGKTEETCVGKLRITSEQSSYCKQDCLTFEAVELDQISIDSKSWNTGETNDSIVVTENGTYTCSVNYTENNTSYQSSISYTVDNIDVTPPSSV